MFKKIIFSNVTIFIPDAQDIYMAATMNYGLGSDDPEELAFYNKIRKEMEDMKKERVIKGVHFN